MKATPITMQSLRAAALVLLFAPLAGAQQPRREDTSGVEEIQVTVERRTQDLQSVPSIAQGFSAEALKTSGVGTELRNLGTVVPGLSIANQEGNVEVFIRGVGSTNNTEVGDPSAATYINGVYIPRPRGLGAQFFDLERVEVQKGPQGTLRGRNAVAGSLNIISKRPDLRGFDAYVETTLGTYGSQIYEGAVNIPLGEKFAVRAAGFSQFHDSYFKNSGTRGLTAAGEESSRAGRLSAFWQATEALSVQVVGDFVREAGTGFPGANLFRTFSSGERFDDVDPRKVIYRGVQGSLDSDHWGVQSTVTYDFGPVVAEYAGSYRDLDFFQRNAASDGIRTSRTDVSGVDFQNFSNVFFLTTSKSNVHELRLFSPDGSRARWSVGAFYFDERQEAGFFSSSDKGFCCFSGVEFTIPDVQARSLAGYADVTYDVTQRFRAKAGIRRTGEEKSRSGIGGNFALRAGGIGADDPNTCCFSSRFSTPGFEPAFLGRPSFDARDRTPAALAKLLLEGVKFGKDDTFGKQLRGVVDGSRPNGTCIDSPELNNGGVVTCPANGQFSFLEITAPDQQIGKTRDRFFDSRAGIEFDLADESLLFASVTTGHKAGGFNDTVANPGFDSTKPESAGNRRLLAAREFKPEKVIAYELGSKNRFDFNGRRVTLNGDLFVYDYSDQVFSVLTAIGGLGGTQNGFSQQNINIADSTIAGLELEGGIDLGAGFTLSGNLLFLRTRIRSGVVSDVRATNFGNLAATPNADLKGNELPLAPKFTGIVKLGQGMDFASGARFDWQVLGNYKSSYFLSIFNEEDVKFDDDVDGMVDRVGDAKALGFDDIQKGYVTLNLGVGYTTSGGALRVEAFVSNLLDEDASTKAIFAPNLNQRFLNDPRTAGVRFRYNF